MTDMRARATFMVLSILVVGFCVGPVMAQEATVTYVVHVDFFHVYCYLSYVQVTLDDKTGRVVATGYSPDGSEIAIIYTTIPTSSLTVRAFGQESIGSYAWSASGISTLNVGTGGDYWILVKML